MTEPLAGLASPYFVHAVSAVAGACVRDLSLLVTAEARGLLDLLFGAAREEDA